MTVSVVVGAQYGSEGKGKVAHHFAVARHAAAAVRVGGSNSGHTVCLDAQVAAFRQLPTAAATDDVLCVIPPGAYIDVPVLLSEIKQTGLKPERLLVDRRATVVTDADRQDERGMNRAIGSTETGVGAAVARRARRAGGSVLAGETPLLRKYLGDTTDALRRIIDAGGRVIVEGTQGFGLSLLHGDHYPMATSRDTSAAAAVSEAGLSPMDVDEVVLVARAFPIRVAGNSGPLEKETTWDVVASEGGLRRDPSEYTTVTHRRRRVGRFSPQIVMRAIAANRPTHLVMNHLDLLGEPSSDAGADRIEHFLDEAETALGRSVNLIGIGPTAVHERMCWRERITASERGSPLYATV